jgi:hypothetical protein
VSSIKGLDKTKVECGVRFSPDILIAQMKDYRKFKKRFQTSFLKTLLEPGE